MMEDIFLVLVFNISAEILSAVSIIFIAIIYY